MSRSVRVSYTYDFITTATIASTAYGVLVSTAIGRIRMEVQIADGSHIIHPHLIDSTATNSAARATAARATATTVMISIVIITATVATAAIPAVNTVPTVLPYIPMRTPKWAIPQRFYVNRIRTRPI